jgi:DNA-binding SARP family transcriptional activator
MKEPLALFWPAQPGMQTPETVNARLEACDYAAAVDAMWAVGFDVIQGLQNLPMKLLAGWLDALPAEWRGDDRVRVMRSWILFDQHHFALALLELEDLAAQFSARLDGPEPGDARNWLMLVRLGQGTIYQAEGRHERAQAAFADVFRLQPALETPGPCPSLELDGPEMERLAALDATGITEVAVKALPYFQARGDRAGMARVAHNLGEQYLEVGEPAAARQWLEKALDLKRSQAGHLPVAYTLDSLGHCYQLMGMLDEAQAALDESLRVATQLGCTAIQASSLSYLGDVYRDRDEFEQAKDLYRKSIALREKLRDACGVGETQLSLSVLHRRSGQPGLAADCAAQAKAVMAGHAPCLFQDRALLCAAIAGVLLGDAEAEAQLARIVAAFAHRPAPSEETLGRWYMAVAAWQRGDTAEAGMHLRGALNLAARTWNTPLLARELPATAGMCAVVSDPQLLAGLVQRATPRGLLALLQSAPAAHDLVAAAGRLPEATALSVRLLGAFRVLRAGREVDMAAARSQKAVSLFKFLVAQWGRPVAREQILDAIWPESDPESADRSFEVTLSTLRRLLDPPQGLTLIVRRGRGYMLNPDVPLMLDAERFQRHLTRGHWWWQRGQADLALAEWGEAEAAYGGDFLADDPYEDWATADRERLREQYLDLVLRLGEAALEAGRPAEAVERAHRVLIADPIREAAYRLLMRAHARQGNRAVAMRDLQRCCEVLQRELGEEPMRETLELARRIRGGEL